MWIVVLVAGIAASVAIAWRASRRRRAGPADDAGNAGASFAGDGTSGPDGSITPDCMDGTSDGGGCDGGGGGGGD
jgi:hypothetical protein